MDVNAPFVAECDAYRTVEQAIEYLLVHAREQPSLAHVAARVGLSEFHFQRRFSALRTEEGHLERLLLREARRHDFPEEPQNLLVAQWTLVAGQGFAQHFSFTLRTVEVDRASRGSFGDADSLRVARPLADQLVDARIDRVDPRADLLERGSRSSYRR